MDLQTRLERILDERRGYVVGTDRTPGKLSELLHDMMPTVVEGALYAENHNERDGWLMRMCGLALFLLHPDDEAATGSTEVGDNGVPLRRSPGPSQAGIAHAFTGFYGTASPEAVVYQLGDGSYRRKPRPDRG